MSFSLSLFLMLLYYCMMKVNMRPELMPSTRAEKSCEGLQRVQLGGIVMFFSFMPASISDCRR